MVATQRMPRGLLNTDYRIWENISHVGLWGNTVGEYINIINRYIDRYMDICNI